MVWGKYFDNHTSWTDEPKVVIGSSFQKDVFEKDGKKYYIYKDVTYEVIGVMGTDEESRINNLILLDLKSGIKNSGVNTSYVLDAGRNNIASISKDLENSISSSATIYINTKEKDESLRDRFLSTDVIVDTMYTMIFISFVLSTVLVTFIWLRARNQLFYVWQLSGYETKWKMIEIIKSYYAIAGTGLATGLIVISVMSICISDIQIVFGDILNAVVITLILGTIILLLCSFIRNRFRLI